MQQTHSQPRTSRSPTLRAAGLSALYAVRRVIRVEALPLLGTGKIDYRSLKRLIAEDNLGQG